MTTAARVAAFMFHEVTDDPTATGFQHPGASAYRHTREGFVRCLDAIAETSASPGLITDTGPTGPADQVLLTFDDGGKSALDAGELLARRGWRGHFFIVTDLIGSRTFLDASQIRTLRKAGHLIGSHSHTHPFIFRALPAARMLEEWRTSRDTLEQLLGEPVLAASVPGGDINARALETADQAGVQYLFTSEPWLVPRRAGGCWILGRFSVKAGTPPRRLRQLAQFRGWTTPLLRRRAKVWASLALPWLYRRYVHAQTQPPPR